MTAVQMINFARKFSVAYSAAMQPLREELHMPQAAADILLFLSSNPTYHTAGDICRIKTLKKGIVSLHVDRLVQEGYLQRRSEEGDRRKCRLVCTEKATPLIEEGRARLERFYEAAVEGLSAAELETFRRCLETIENNMERLGRKEADAPPEKGETYD